MRFFLIAIALLLVIATQGFFCSRTKEEPLPPQPKSVNDYLGEDIPLPQHFDMVSFEKKETPEQNFLLTLEGTQFPSSFIQQYRQVLQKNGWLEYGITEAFGDVVTLIAQKNGRRLEVIATLDELSGKTVVTMSVRNI